MTEHHLKTWPVFFNATLSGRKPFEVRKNDRDFQEDDILILEEYDPISKRYTGRVIIKKVEYILVGDGEPKHCQTAGIMPGYCVMGLTEPY